MITQKNLTKEWLEKVSKSHKNIDRNINADKILIEKTIRAFLLLEGLVKHNFSFVFKGGTALMLHFNSAKRLSIDIDIILPQEPSDLDKILDSVAKEQGFIRKELQYRSTQLNIKKEHYKFFYNPLHKTQEDEDFILLDILFEDVIYHELISKPIKSSFLPVESESMNVDIPSHEDFMGDKLTAFAPNTTGIPYFKNEDSMSMEIIKQLFDIGNLFDVVNNVEKIVKTFNLFAETELNYREHKGLKPEDVLEDIYKTSLCIATRGSDGKGNFYELQTGIQRLQNFIFSENYHIEKAILHASKAAYLATVIKHRFPEIEKYENPEQIKHWSIDHPINTKLNKLKKTNPEAFFYWYKIYELKLQGS